MDLMSTPAVTVWGEAADSWIYHQLVICQETISVLTKDIITQSKILAVISSSILIHV